MTQQELFKKYSIDESHALWDHRVDNWMSVELFRLMHNGELPKEDGNDSVLYITDFLDKTKDMRYMAEIMKRDDWGSLYLTAKRQIYSLSELILHQLNQTDLKNPQEA